MILVRLQNQVITGYNLCIHMYVAVRILPFKDGILKTMKLLMTIIMLLSAHTYYFLHYSIFPDTSVIDSPFSHTHTHTHTLLCLLLLVHFPMLGTTG